MKAHLDQILQDLKLEDFEIQINNKRCKYPTANIYPNMKPPLISIQGNKPSLIRYALADLLLHEVTHYHFLEKKPDYNGDHHEDSDFQILERFYKDQLIRLIAEEHD
jgi:hypothetical protein